MSPLNIRSIPFEVPSYSLTGDILSYLRCGLQYRYYNGSSLPPSRPIQMWTGEFVHGVLEEAYRFWIANNPPFPWPCNVSPWPPDLALPLQQSNDIGVLGHRTEVRLAASGKRSRSEAARSAAYMRVEAAVNALGPHLFPLITSAEERISGTRAMPTLAQGVHARGDRYELTGIVDVISSMAVNEQNTNLIVQLIRENLANTPDGEYDVIVDYKAGRRPPLGSEFRDRFTWQVQTYAWLRNQIADNRRVGAGVLIFVNELSMSRTDFDALRTELQNHETEITPPNGSADYYAIYGWHPGDPIPTLSLEYRLRRALMVVETVAPVVTQAVDHIDQVVRSIEEAAFQEHNSGVIQANWPACGEVQDCDACDFYFHCPSPAYVRIALQQNPNAPVPPRAAPIAPGN
jgi:PD-(D/E)XK nuclease superfamily